MRPGLWIVFVPIVGGALLVGVAGLGLLISRAHRARGAALIAAGVLVVVPYPLAIRAGADLRMAGFESFVERSQPLVQAIRAYDRDHGQPPAALAALVPEYLAAVPGTGIGPSPVYVFESGTPATTRYGERWVVRVPCSIGLLNWDEIIYYPSGDYPDHVGHGRLERIGDWAYLHE